MGLKDIIISNCRSVQGSYGRHFCITIKHNKVISNGNIFPLCEVAGGLHLGKLLITFAFDGKLLLGQNSEPSGEELRRNKRSGV